MCLLYAATSQIISGVCLSVRWFVPLLAAGYLALAVLVREVPAARTDLAVLLAGGLAIGVEGTIRGPWYGHILTTYWPVVGVTLTAWGAIWVRRAWTWAAGRTRPPVTAGTGPPEPSRASDDGVNGFWRNAPRPSSTPCRTTASSVYPDRNSTRSPGAPAGAARPAPGRSSRASPRRSPAGRSARRGRSADPQRLRPVGRLQHRVPGPPAGRAGQGPDRRLVLHQEDRLGAARRRPPGRRAPAVRPVGQPRQVRS